MTYLFGTTPVRVFHHDGVWWWACSDLAVLLGTPSQELIFNARHGDTSMMLLPGRSRRSSVISSTSVVVLVQQFYSELPRAKRFLQWFERWLLNDVPDPKDVSHGCEQQEMDLDAEEVVKTVEPVQPEEQMKDWMEAIQQSVGPCIGLSPGLNLNEKPQRENYTATAQYVVDLQAWTHHTATRLQEAGFSIHAYFVLHLAPDEYEWVYDILLRFHRAVNVRELGEAEFVDFYGSPELTESNGSFIGLGHPPLSLAFLAGRDDLVPVLLELGANPYLMYAMLTPAARGLRLVKVTPLELLCKMAVRHRFTNFAPFRSMLNHMTARSYSFNRSRKDGKGTLEEYLSARRIMLFKPYARAGRSAPVSAAHETHV